MKRMIAFAPLSVLVACVQATADPTAPPRQGLPRIEVSGGGVFSGSSRTVIYANDVLATEQTSPTEKPVSRVVQGKPGAYDAALAVVRADGPGIRRAMAGKADTFDCMDYGTDSVTLTPAMAEFDSVAANCPEQALLAFQRKVLDAASGAD